MRFVVERDFLKPASSVTASSDVALWSVMSAGGEKTRVGAEVRPKLVETEEWNRENLREMSH